MPAVRELAEDCWFVRRGILFFLVSMLTACATQAPTSDLKLVMPAPSVDTLQVDPPGWTPVTDLAARYEVPGATILPPLGAAASWAMARFHDGERSGVVFGSLGAEGSILANVVMSMPADRSDCRSLRSAEPDLLRATALVEIPKAFGKSARVGEIDIRQAGDPPEVWCVLLRVEADQIVRASAGPQRGIPQRGAMSMTGKFCPHPDVPRIIGVLVGQWTPEGRTPMPPNNFINGNFIDSLRFLPSGIASRQGIDLSLLSGSR